MINRSLLILDFRWMLVLIAMLYLVGVARQWQLNTNMQRTDQSAYLDYAQGIATDPDYVGDHNRMPLYPWLQSLHYSEGEGDQAFFIRGNALNVVLSTLILLVISGYFWREFRPELATMAITLTALFIFAYMAPYFQAELLFFGMLFLCFLLFLHLIQQPSFGLAIVLGILLGLTHLIKSSVLIMLGVFVGVFLLQLMIEERELSKLIHKVGMLILLILAFFATIFPYIQTSKRVYGSYMYNVNTTFYMWYDSWDEVEAGTKAADDRLGYPDLPAEEIPSLGRYLRTHSLLEIVQRIANGLSTTFYKHTFQSYGYAKYMLIYAGALLYIGLSHRQKTWEFLKRHRWLVLFVVGTFVAYSLAYAWWVPLSTGRRFMLSLWLPALYILMILLQRVNLAKLHRVVYAVLWIEIIFFWINRIGHMPA